ncbi:hypothetical protein VI03_23085 [Burkholderia vietnamiensis]|uniref:Uncharacterized protein n=1 Tax=Burkholderia vietnamiensis TaxID=60552 RepID=A0AAW7SY31_BURVI|nr:hypothetical protein [Burkholderia vietnamiensis]KKI36420.1 hypothetical protein VI03_23085 [Burkholderia vietnamiensis]MBJ9688120.1 hypothetical protein [Burkholderia vietnamiensis]MBR8050099.1 hypothetical protein [Burkholderia vietnamiensis]MDN7794220.1 hypothetical protein [Burkholderia vietnamiensis]HDR9075404.1 hypothetical protein [Burkholderia vietnamiensis]
MAGAPAARPDRPPPAPAPAPIHPRRRTHASATQRPSARPVVPIRGGFGGIGRLAHPYDTAVVAAVALVLHYWGARTGIRADELQLDDDEG